MPNPGLHWRDDASELELPEAPPETAGKAAPPGFVVEEKAVLTGGLQLRELLTEHQGLLQRNLDLLLQRQDLILARLAEARPALDESPRRPPPVPAGCLGSEEARVAQKEVAKVREALAEKEPVGLLSKAYRTRSEKKLQERRRSSAGSGKSSQRSVRSVEAVAGAAFSPAASSNYRSEKEWRELLSKEVLFDIVASAMILVNALIMGIETEYSVQHGNGGHVGFLYAQVVLNVWFVLELLLRLTLLERCRCVDGSWRWNLFDGCLVAFSLADLIQVVQTGFARSVSSTGRLMRIIRLARVVRLARLCRSLSHVHQFRKMVYCLQSSLSTLAWALLLLVAVMYAFAVLFVQGAAERREAEGLEATGAMLQHYGGILRAITTLYKAVTGGQSWTELLEPLEQADGFLGALFLAYISTVFFGVLNVVTAVFVESAMDAAEHYKDLRIYEVKKSKESLVRHIRTVFAQLDADASGTVSYREMEAVFQDAQLRMYVESLGVTLEDTVMLFQLMDLDDSGHVDIEEFCNGLLRLQGEARSFDLHLLIFEMAKLQNKWDNFVAYFCLKFDEAPPPPLPRRYGGSINAEDGACAAVSRRWSNPLSATASAPLRFLSAQTPSRGSSQYSPPGQASASLKSWSLHRPRIES